MEELVKIVCLENPEFLCCGPLVPYQGRFCSCVCFSLWIQLIVRVHIHTLLDFIQRDHIIEIAIFAL